MIPRSLNDDNLKPFHSNGYASVSVGNRLGSGSSETFSQRRQIENNRSIVQGYNRSSIGVGYNNYQRAKQVGADRQPNTSVNVNRSQPTARRYDPFSS